MSLHRGDLSEFCTTTNETYNKYKQSDEKLLREELLFICDHLCKHLPHYFHEHQMERMSLAELLVELWSQPNFREEYFENRFKLDPYLVLPTLCSYLERGSQFNVKRTCFFEPVFTNQRYLTCAYSTKTSNYPYKTNQLSFELFANCFSCDTWADVVAVSFSLSDYDNLQYLNTYFNECKRLSKFTCYRIILIFTHPDVFQERIKLGVKYQGNTDPNIRKELNRLKKDCALIINSLITETLKVMINNQDNSYPNRTYEYHIVNTSHDSDMKELLNCLAIGANSPRKCFITHRFDLPLFVIPNNDFKHNLHGALQMRRLDDIILDFIH
ncbi:predicted protein [Naegleria gruberi]|uniref:Predicted protein n=1 Tax=Naegleria gruberi TaxID=5762 RepID=D2V166_NAEGR|nr:uncharacterized protein NAEGRDRAFT_62775 [Naegleria gruberi]EFC49415.1 predicted protein [Naegleria gruberi]|eukprot:XP_002682159.1 predicted protein [Naegleria gruberi strain NEG-M]